MKPTAMNILHTEAARGGTRALARYGIKGAAARALTGAAEGPGEPEHAHEQVLREMMRAVSSARGFKLCFLVYTTRSKREQLEPLVRKATRGGRTVRIDAGATPSAQQLLEELDRGPPHQAVQLVGLDSRRETLTQGCALLSEAGKTPAGKLERPVLIWIGERHIRGATGDAAVRRTWRSTTFEMG